MKKTVPFILAAFCAAFCFLLPARPLQGADRKIEAFVSILPQQYLVQKVGGDLVHVSVLVGPGQSHETFEPTPQQISRLARSDIFFAIGAPFEKALVPRVKSMFPKLAVVDTAAGVPLLSFAPGSGEHGLDPHIWLDPKRARTIARNISKGLALVDPAHARTYEANLQSRERELGLLDAEITRLLAPVKGRTLFVFHPAFQYFCQSYGLRQQAFEYEGKEPSARQMSRLIGEMKKEGVKVIFVQPQFSQKAARAIAQSIGAVVVPLNPLPGDYPRDMLAMATTVRDALLGRPGVDAKGANP